MLFALYDAGDHSVRVTEPAAVTADGSEWTARAFDCVATAECGEDAADLLAKKWSRLLDVRVGDRRLELRNFGWSPGKLEVPR